MAGLQQSRCFNHAGREAVARCPSCRRFFCRECVTEHAGKVICAACLQPQVQADDTAGPAIRERMGRLVQPLRAAAGLFLLWMLFYAAGRILLLIPDSFHSGELWRGP